MCSKEFCDTADGFVPAYRDGAYILCSTCYQEELSDDEFHRPWAYEQNDTPSLCTDDGYGS
jgi:hypothetical protein